MSESQARTYKCERCHSRQPVLFWVRSLRVCKTCAKRLIKEWNEAVKEQFL